MTTIKIPIRTVYDNSNTAVGLAEFQTGEVIGISQGGTSANTAAQARINLEVDTANIRGLFGVSGDLSYNSSTGVFSFTNDPGDIESVTAGNGLTGGGTSGNVTLDVVGGFGITVNVDNVEVNKSEINALARTAITVGGAATYDNTTGNIYVNGGVTKVAGATGDVSNAQILSGIQQTGYLTTANITEVSNLYYTVARANSAIDNRVNKSFIDNLNVDADTLDSQDGTYYLDWTNTTNKPDPVVNVTLTGDVTGAAEAILADVTSNTITISTTIAPNSVEMGVDTTGPYVGNLVAGTGVSISGLGGENTSPTISIGQAVATTSDVQFANVTVTGNLLVQGNTVQFTANNLVVSDPLIQMGANPVGDALDLGFFAHYIGGSPSIERHAGLFRDATDGQFKLFTNLDPEPSTIVDTANASYQSANLVVNFVVGKVTDISNHTTTNLSEGTNLYFNNTRAIGALTGGSGISIAANGRLTSTILDATGNIIPATDNSFSIGTLTKRYTDLYLSGNSLHLANIVLKDNGSTLEVFREGNSVFIAQASSGFVDSSITTWPGAEGNSDYGLGEAYVGENAIISDAFGVQLGSVFSMMEPKGKTDSYDLEVLT